MDYCQIIDILFYEAVDIFPNLFLAYIPFCHHLRLSPPKTFSVSLLLYGLLVLCRILTWHYPGLSTVMTVLWVLIYFLFYGICIRGRVIQMLFVLITILNYNSFIMIIGSHLAFHQLGNHTAVPYSFTHTLMNLLVMLPTYPVVAHVYHKKFRPLIDFTEQPKIWRYLWLIPATFCLSYYYNLYSGGGILSYTERLQNVLFAAFYNVGAFFVTYVIVRLLEVSQDYLLLKTANYHLSLQSLQYDNMQQRIEDARRANHDLRQSLALISTYLNDGSYDSLKDYLKDYVRKLSPAATVVYCPHYALNAVIVYYDKLANEHNIQLKANVAVPSQLPIEDSDLVVLFGNLLENAVEGCLRCPPGNRFISLTVQYPEPSLVIVMKNSYNSEEPTPKPTPKPNQEPVRNTPIPSSKGPHGGIGLQSIRNICEKYHGTAEFEGKDAVFHSSAICTPKSHDNKERK